jgi:large subunit ribosomal protein L21
VYAIVEDSGTQIIVRQGDVLDIDLRGEDTDSVIFDRVLALKGEGDETARIGTPYIEGASVTAEVLSEVKGEKIDVIKFKRRKGYKRKQGHRQRSLRVKINDIKG